MATHYDAGFPKLTATDRVVLGVGKKTRPVRKGEHSDVRIPNPKGRHVKHASPTADYPSTSPPSEIRACAAETCECGSVIQRDRRTGRMPERCKRCGRKIN